MKTDNSAEGQAQTASSAETVHWPRGFVLLVLTLLSLSLGWMVKSPPVTGQGKPATPPATAPKPFHQVHVTDLNVVCTACHDTAQTPKPGHELAFSVRPGHAACEGCHEDDFKKENVKAETTATALCRTCHTGKGEAVGRFPSGRLTLAQFSHASHVDPRPPVSKLLGIRQDCIFCHTVEAKAPSPARPGHPECAACHAGAGGAKPALAKEDVVDRCLTCHALERIDRNMRRTATTRPQGAAHPASDLAGNPHARGHALPTAGQHAYRDIRPFNHGSHLQRRDGAPIDCTTCHAPVLQKHAVDTASRLPTMRECAACHANATFVRAETLIKNCQTCHTVMHADLRPRASDPVSPAIAHTEAFRVHHEAQARDPDNQCGACHTRFVNVGQNNCAGCHSSMQPRSHVGLRFAEMLHGRLAALDRKVCTNCHTGDFCVACHSVLPRSHIPLRTFVRDEGGAHAVLAILNLRSCYTCHTHEPTCSRCHRRELR
ncbi:MAG: hypothetical protein HY726_21840 [Candidatus Rokubacteria bacterium]|nr:hypothetical protein [Candidatus Rokubacteria bacterium]